MSTKTHNLIPTHTLLTTDEKTKLLESLGVSIKEIPKIKINDSGITDLDAKSGDIIKIIRSSRSAGESEYYRVVIE